MTSGRLLGRYPSLPTLIFWPLRSAAPISFKDDAMKIAAKRCEHCDGILWRSQFSEDGKSKSCPCCSRRHGRLHVFLGYPADFGRRRMLHNPRAAQSHCLQCRPKRQGYCDRHSEELPHGARLCGQGVEPR